jgi:hypothetical protein
VPLIGGWDSAFSAIGRPGVDYLRVSSMPELQFALDRLVSDPALYSAIAEAGRDRAGKVGHEAIAQAWLDCLDRQVAPAFDAWRERGGWGLRSSTARVLDRARETVSNGKRLLRGAKTA